MENKGGVRFLILIFNRFYDKYEIKQWSQQGLYYYYYSRWLQLSI